MFPNISYIIHYYAVVMYIIEFLLQNLNYMMYQKFRFLFKKVLEIIFYYCIDRSVYTYICIYMRLFPYRIIEWHGKDF